MLGAKIWQTFLRVKDESNEKKTKKKEGAGKINKSETVLFPPLLGGKEKKKGGGESRDTIN